MTRALLYPGTASRMLRRAPGPRRAAPGYTCLIMNHLSPPDAAADFGTHFDYSVWTPSTEVTLCNVPWDSTYRDVVWFNDYDEAYDHIVNKHTRHASWTHVTGMTYLRQGQPIRLDVPFSKANQYNYVIARNPRDAFNSRNTFFYFITDVAYVAPGTTELHLQLDVWQSYMHEWKVKRCYVERSHLGIAAEDQWHDYGRMFLTAPEGLDTGSDYVVGDAWRECVGATPEPEEGQEYDTALFDVIVCSTIALEEEYGTVDDPKVTSAKGSLAEGLPNGCGVYAMTSDAFLTMRDALAYAPWIAAGIISITSIPRGIIDWDRLADRKTKLPDVPHDGKSATNAEVYVAKKGFGDAFKNGREIKLATPFRTESALPDRYKHLWKFYTAPYMWIEVTTFTGTPLLVRPESINSSELKVTQWAHVVPPNPRVMYTVNDHNMYDRWTGPRTPWNGYGEHFDAMTGFTNLPQYSVTNNGYLQFMASNAHGIAYQHQAADWSQQKALRGASTQFAQANASRQQASDETDLSNYYNSRMTQYNADQRFMQQGVNAIGSGLGAALSGNVVGGAINALTTGYQMGNQYGMSLENQRMKNEAASAMTGLKKSYGKYFADSNLQYAKFAAQGDYANTIAGINAKVQDAQVIAPSSAGQSGGDAFMLSVEGWWIHARQKILNVGAMQRIGEFWLRYGYALNVFTVPPSDLRCMEHFTYWQMKEVNLSSSTCPELFKQTIRGIFEKGVTVWHRTMVIGSQDIGENEPLKGIQIGWH